MAASSAVMEAGASRGFIQGIPDGIERLGNLWLMLPNALTMAVTWILLFVVRFALSIPLGPGYPVRV
jgi:p-aminobenzoyl-glutamate transporter AbgT